jgi:hypothetical protein
MKWKPFKIPIAVRVFIFILGVVSASFSVDAVRAGMIHEGNHGKPYDITEAHDPVAFFALVFIFSLLSAGLFYVACARRYPDA